MPMERTRTRTLCVDFDGTITQYTHYRGRGVFDPPIPGAAETLRRLKAEGWRIIVYTTRTERDEIAAYLHEHGIPFDGINEDSDPATGAGNGRGGKPAADVYLDDRGVPFRGDWDQAYRDIYALLEWKREWKEKARRREQV